MLASAKRKSQRQGQMKTRASESSSEGDEKWPSDGEESVASECNCGRRLMTHWDALGRTGDTWRHLETLGDGRN